jgi:hypothetical protein
VILEGTLRMMGAMIAETLSQLDGNVDRAEAVAR